MALSKSNLGFPIVVGAGSSVAVYTVSSSKKSYIRTILVHNVGIDTTLSQTARVYMVPNNGGSAGVATVGNTVARLSLVPDETVFFEPQYPFTLEDNGDTIQVLNEGSNGPSGATNDIVVTILGDKDA
jgi:hypothetical protein|tara:strand:- start:185 stop:568 length:384 start_codon:yes stop_codon:yes gene_type:complete